MMNLDIILTKEAQNHLDHLARDKGMKRTYKAVAKALRLMSENLRPPSLATHEFHSKQGPAGQKIFESYAQNHTPAAQRLFWYYGPGKKEITVVAVIPHP